MVANVTIAAMLAYYPLEVWNQTVVANITTSRNIYSFSRPLNLILPYALSLVASLPFLAVGYISLRRNGVSAQSDSFVQLLVAMTRSRGLDDMVRPCSRRKDEVAVRELKKTKIVFGEIAESKGNGVGRRMGFGLKHEIMRVNK